MEYQSIIEAATFLGHQEMVTRLQNLAVLKEKNCFFLTFWGEFSAGKTRLINTILGRELLPVHITETTAVPTFIRYGEQEKAVVQHMNGSSEQIDSDMLKEIWNKSGNEEKLKDINYLEVYFPSELLKEGLVIVDTPGVNTTIERHQTAAVTAIESSGKLVYVLGGPVSKEEAKWIRNIGEKGVDMLFVRTKCDQISSSEENSQESLAQEKQELEKICGKEIDFYPVSSEKGWEQEREKFLVCLKKDTANIQKLNDECCEKEAKRIAKLCLDELEQRSLDLQNTIQGNKEQVEKNRKKCNEALALLRKKEKNNLDRIEQEMQHTEWKAKKKLEEKLEQLQEAFEETLPSEPLSESFRVVIDDYYTNWLDHAVQEIQSILYDTLNEWVKENNDSIESLCVNDSQKSLVIQNSYSEVEQQCNELIEKIEKRLEDTKSELEEVQNKIQTYGMELASREQEDEIASLDEQWERKNQELAEIPSDVQMMEVESDGIRPSNAWATVGMLVDTALFFLPGKAVVAGTKGVLDSVGASAKIVTMVNNAKKTIGSTKEGAALLKTIGKMSSEVVKNANQIDTTHDIALMLKGFTSRWKYSNKKAAETGIDTALGKAGDVYDQVRENKQNGGRSGTLLDRLSVEYWARRIGEKFDPKPKYRIDYEVEEQKQKAREILMREQDAIMQKKLQKKQELGQLQDEKQRLMWIEKQKQSDVKRIEEHLQKESENIKRTAVRQWIDKMRKDYIKVYQLNIKKLSTQITDIFLAEATINMGIYSEQQLAQLREQIKAVESKLEELLNNDTSENMQKYQAELETCIGYKEALARYL